MTAWKKNSNKNDWLFDRDNGGSKEHNHSHDIPVDVDDSNDDDDDDDSDDDDDDPISHVNDIDDDILRFT